MEPLGFAFEAFDGAGVERDLDNGQPIDSSGSFPFVDGAAHFEDARELMRVMVNGLQAHQCYAKHVAGYALQRDIAVGDQPLLDSLAAVSRASSLREMIVALVREPAFRLREEGLP
jgi:hypothetical protein